LLSPLPQSLSRPHYPLVLGEGRRFFKEARKKSELTLMSAVTTQKGVTLLTYRYAGAAV